MNFSWNETALKPRTYTQIHFLYYFKGTIVHYKFISKIVYAIKLYNCVICICEIQVFIFGRWRLSFLKMHTTLQHIYRVKSSLHTELYVGNYSCLPKKSRGGAQICPAQIVHSRGLIRPFFIFTRAGTLRSLCPPRA